MKKLLLLLILIPLYSEAVTYLATTASEIQNYTNLLQAGDTLLVQDGSYDLNWNISDRSGAGNDWIVIRAVNNNARINGVNYDNVVDIYNCHYVELLGFEITNAYVGSGIDGIKFRTTSDHIRMEDLHIHDLTGVGISANPAGQSFTFLTIRHCHIHDITDVGEGLYIGNHDGLSPVFHCLVERNWIHDCHPHKGIQFKRGTWMNLVQDNVVYNCDEAGIVLYKTDQSIVDSNNIVRRNAVWSAPEGIFAVGQTNIENNVIFNCGYGINVRNYSGWGMKDLFIRNNTIYSCATTGLCLDDWDVATADMVCVNNAVYQDSLGMSAIQAPNGIGPGLISHNRHYGQSQVAGSILGNPPSLEFINPGITPGDVDLYPRPVSALRDSGSSGYGAPDHDFDFFPRPFNGIWDIGAYEWSQNTNPGWIIHEDFKEIPTGIAEDKTALIPSEHGRDFITNGVIEWSGLDPGTRVKIYDMCGRSIHDSILINGKKYKFSSIRLAVGVYYYIFMPPDAGRSISGKIVRIH